MHNADRRQQHEARYRPSFVVREKLKDIKTQLNILIVLQIIMLFIECKRHNRD